MADFPIPIGIDRMLLDIAKGIGDAARALPERSRSNVGAVALKRAVVQIDFELSSAATRQEDIAGLGAKTFLFGFGASSETTAELARNHGRIELEVVAITEPEPVSDDRTTTDDWPDVPLDRHAIRTAISLLQAQIAQLPFSDSDRENLTSQLAQASQLLSEGNPEGAAEILRYITKRIQALTGPADNGDVP